MRIVAFITEPKVIDRILEHLRRTIAALGALACPDVPISPPIPLSTPVGEAKSDLPGRSSRQMGRRMAHTDPWTCSFRRGILGVVERKFLVGYVEDLHGPRPENLPYLRRSASVAAQPVFP